MSIRILIANRANAALKFILSIRDFFEDDDTKIRLIGIVTKEDLVSSYAYVEYLDEIVRCESDRVYNDIEQIVRICKETEVSYVYPGWGYLSENADFVEALEKEKITFIGPSSETMRMLGDKINAMTLAESLNVPLLPWSGPKPMRDLERVRREIERVGLPCILKEAGGGGGRGIRIVRRRDEIENAFAALSVEGSGSGRIFVMALATNACHLEFQIVGDGERAICLHGRDCSIQRRAQKIIEEAPITNAPPETIRELEKASIRLAEAVSYKGLGTVEYLWERQSGRATFLEVNTRLQVEHPCTERIYGLNLPAIMLQIALGKTVAELFPTQPKYSGHCIALRVVSEDAYDAFQPKTGNIDDIDFRPATPDVFGYFSLRPSGRIIASADGQFGHIFVCGKDRESARKRALRMIRHEIRIKSKIPNTLRFQREVLQSDAFREQRFHTRMLENFRVTNDIDMRIVLVGLVIRAMRDFDRETVRIHDLRQRGHKRTDPKRRRQISLVYRGVTFKTFVRCAHDRISVEIDDKREVCFRVDRVQDDRMLLSCGRVPFSVWIDVDTDDGFMTLHVNGRCVYFTPPKDPSRVCAPTSGRLLKHYRVVGQSIRAGELLLDIEVMKMCLGIRAETDGVVEYVHDIGVIEEGATLVTLDVKDKLQKIEARPIHAADLPATDIVVTPSSSSTPSPVATTSIECPLRRRAASVGTTYVEDLVRMFDSTNITELVVENDEIRPGCGRGNGMRFWEIYRDAARFVVVANDITIQAGSFSEVEDAIFHRAVSFCRIRSIPCVYISCNSGARLDIHEDVRKSLKVKWKDVEHAAVGVEYLYLTTEDKERFEKSVKVEATAQANEWKIVAIDHNGRRNLNGSGVIAAQMSKAYDDVVTLSLVTGRSVGIGAYLVRLGHRVIQKRNSPILLTGASALNALLGRQLYTSNLEIGGPTIMATNGLSQHVVDTDEEGVRAIERWLDFSLRKKIEAKPPARSPSRSLRGIRSWILEHVCDAESWMETMQDFAPNLRTGRARINGIAVGIVASETIETYQNVPHDPAMEASSIRRTKLAAGVLYPSSSRKFAQTIRDVDREGLPLLIVANWRGFSGGASSMFEGVLQNGSRIVDALARFRQPVYLHVPDRSQLRGGAMVVVAKGINARIKMTRAPTAKINVLEPEGLAQIKAKARHFPPHIVEKGLRAMGYIAQQFCELHEVPVRGDLFEKVVLEELRESITAHFS